MRGLRVALASLALLWGCRPPAKTLTIAIALLPSELPAYRAVLADFERDSGLRVVVVPQQYADIRRALAAEAVAGGGTLDLVELDVYSLSAAARYVAPLDAAALGPASDALDPQALRAGRIDGLRFLPHRIAWQALIYNQAVLEKPPATWEELLAVARSHPGQVGLKGALYEGLTCDLLPFVWAAGGSGEVLDDAGARAAFAFFAELAPYLNPQSQTFKESTVAEAMARGEIVLHLNWPFVMSLYASQGLAPQTIRSAPLPAGPHGRATVLGGGYIAVPRSAPHPEAALRLARYLVSYPAQRRFARQLGWFSARRDVAVPGSSELLAGFIEMRGQVRPRPERPDYQRLSRLWQQAFRSVVFAHADPGDTLQAAQRDLTGQ
ncbi:MAG: ABC-type sugar transport system, periplasmic component [Deltaproteobacteria bacterium]|nr:ABC-type sugar transport system, periplasmic component [Deltaproteobacteria bacterium]